MPKLSHLPYIDPESQFLIAMPPEHHSRHEGEAFSYSLILPTIAVGASYYIEIRTPSVAHEVAMKVIDVTADKVIRTEFIEAPTITTVGTTPIPLIQRNRRSTNESHIKLFSNPAGISGGTLLRSLLYGSGSSFTPVHVSDNDDNGWSLKNSTTYVIRLTNVGDFQATYIGVHGLFFEVDR